MLWLRTWQLGVKSLLLHPMRSLLTMSGIFIGVWSVIWLLAISEGVSIQARKQIGAWLSHYNQTRPHSTFDGQTPDEVYNLSHFQRADPGEKKQAA